MDKQALNILFVCYGNMCRSPIAEGLAKKILDGKTHVESAGILPSRNRAVDEAIKVMLDEFGIDISDHRPRCFKDIDPYCFDTFIALDSYVYNCLKKDHRIDSGRLVQWTIKDPFESSIDTYRECAFDIQRCIQGL